MTTPHDKGANTAHSSSAPSPAHSGQFGELGQTGKGTDLTEQMDSTGALTDDQGNPVELIPWNPAGKIDDEVERRSWPSGQPPSQAGRTTQGDVHTGAVKGGTDQSQENTGPGRYGGPTGQPMVAQRYAGASDNAPTDPVAGATTTLAADAAAAESSHTMRAPAAADPYQTWEGGAASDQAMQAAQEFEHAAPAPPVTGHAAPAPPAPHTAPATGQHSSTTGSTHTAPSHSGHGQKH